MGIQVLAVYRPQEGKQAELEAEMVDHVPQLLHVWDARRPSECRNDVCRVRAPRIVLTVNERFGELHTSGTFVMPNPWEIGSARILESLGFPALATTSSGHAAALGRLDQHVTLSELLSHVAALVAAVDVPLNVDAERCFADDPDGVADTVRQIAMTRAAGTSTYTSGGARDADFGAAFS